MSSCFWPKSQCLCELRHKFTSLCSKTAKCRAKSYCKHELASVMSPTRVVNVLCKVCNENLKWNSIERQIHSKAQLYEKMSIPCEYLLKIVNFFQMKLFLKRTIKCSMCFTSYISPSNYYSLAPKAANTSSLMSIPCYTCSTKEKRLMLICVRCGMSKNGKICSNVRCSFVRDDRNYCVQLIKHLAECVMKGQDSSNKQLKRVNRKFDQLFLKKGKGKDKSSSNISSKPESDLEKAKYLKLIDQLGKKVEELNDSRELLSKQLDEKGKVLVAEQMANRKLKRKEQKKLEAENQRKLLEITKRRREEELKRASPIVANIFLSEDDIVYDRRTTLSRASKCSDILKMLSGLFDLGYRGRRFMVYVDKFENKLQKKKEIAHFVHSKIEETNVYVLVVDY